MLPMISDSNLAYTQNTLHMAHNCFLTFPQRVEQKFYQPLLQCYFMQLKICSSTANEYTDIHAVSYSVELKMAQHCFTYTLPPSHIN